MTKEEIRRRLVRDYHRTFATEEGKRVLAHLESSFGFANSSVIPKPDGSIDPLTTHVREGQKDPLRTIHAFLAEYCLDDTEEDKTIPTVTK